MIVKIKNGDEWSMFDELRNVTFVRYHRNSCATWSPDDKKWGRLNSVTGERETFSPTYDFGERQTRPVEHTANFIRAIRKFDGEVVTFVFHEGYLLNDKGVTIESIRFGIK